MDRTILQQAQALYTDAPWRDRYHVAVRRALCPFERLAAFVPSTGLIVDLGCGHGLFANALALEAPRRCIVGVELSTRKLLAARATQSAALTPAPSPAIGRGETVAGQVHFVQGDLLANPVVGPCRAMLLIDVLYLFTPHQQEQILCMCSERLEPGGVLVLKTMDTLPRWKSALDRLEEWMAVRLFHITLSGRSPLAFRPLAEWAALCQAMGFETRVVRLDQGYYHPHGAVVGLKR
jgi:SAM-dependent methyltransferase